MDSGVACQSRNCVEPGEGITQQSVQQQQRRTHAVAQIAHARAVQGNPMILDGVRRLQNVEPFAIFAQFSFVSQTTFASGSSIYISDIASIVSVKGSFAAPLFFS